MNQDQEFLIKLVREHDAKQAQFSAKWTVTPISLPEYRHRFKLESRYQRVRETVTKLTDLFPATLTSGL